MLRGPFSFIRVSSLGTYYVVTFERKVTGTEGRLCITGARWPDYLHYETHAAHFLFIHGIQPCCVAYIEMKALSAYFLVKGT